jgi:hypothetical protein
VSAWLDHSCELADRPLSVLDERRHGLAKDYVETYIVDVAQINELFRGLEPSYVLCGADIGVQSEVENL